MSIKISSVFYPHTVIEYLTVEQFIEVNGYKEYYAAANALQDRHIDRSDPAVYQEGLSDDGFEAIVTILFEDEASYQAYQIELDSITSDAKQPFFMDERLNPNDALHLF